MNLDRVLEVARRYPTEIEVYPIAANVHEMRRQNAKHAASITVNVPDETVVSLRGEEKQRDLLIFIRIPRAVAERGETRLVLPGIDPIPAPRGKR